MEERERERVPVVEEGEREEREHGGEWVGESEEG